MNAVVAAEFEVSEVWELELVLDILELDEIGEEEGASSVG